MKYLEKKFSVPIQVNISQETWDRIFKKEKKSGRNNKHRIRAAGKYQR
jgi:hypothetical protein